MRIERISRPKTRAPRTDPRTMARVFEWPWLLADAALVEVDAAPAKEADVCDVEEGFILIEVIDDEDDDDVVDVLVPAVDVAASEAKIEVTSV